MGDRRRFDLMAELVASQFPQHVQAKVADVAGGKGYLRMALYEHGFRHVTVIDKRHRLSKGRPGQKWGYFKFDCMNRYSLVLGMHPDEATDHIIMYAARNKVPFVVCPCCVKPDAVMYNGTRTFTPWIQHLLRLAQPTHTVEQFTLRMTGKNLVLVGRPKK